MSDNATMILQEQVSDELLNMPLSKFFAFENLARVYRGRFEKN
jgi:hypothetical protein